MRTELEEHGEAVLAEDRAEVGLRAGDVGTVVHVYGDGEGYEVEFMNKHGDTLAVLTLPCTAVRAVAPGEIPHVRTPA